MAEMAGTSWGDMGDGYEAKWVRLNNGYDIALSDFDLISVLERRGYDMEAIRKVWRDRNIGDSG